MALLLLSHVDQAEYRRPGTPRSSSTSVSLPKVGVFRVKAMFYKGDVFFPLQGIHRTVPDHRTELGLHGDSLRRQRHSPLPT